MVNFCLNSMFESFDYVAFFDMLDALYFFLFLPLLAVQTPANVSHFISNLLSVAQNPES